MISVIFPYLIPPKAFICMVTKGCCTFALSGIMNARLALALYLYIFIRRLGFNVKRPFKFLPMFTSGLESSKLVFRMKLQTKRENV